VPSTPDLCWPLPVRELLVPCTGRLQPEHILKAFELGADVVCVIGCEEDNCHTLEGSSRCARRVDYVRGLLDQIGIGGDRLLRFKLPGSARQDMSLAASETCEPSARPGSEDTDTQLQALRQTIRDSIANLKLSPIHNSQWSTATAYPVEDDAQSED
jgi:coenzyme F420-reducing hydrogenase delta subunit